MGGGVAAAWSLLGGVNGDCTRSEGQKRNAPRLRIRRSSWGVCHSFRVIRPEMFLLAPRFLFFLLGRILARRGLLALLQLLLLLRVLLR